MDGCALRCSVFGGLLLCHDERPMVTTSAAAKHTPEELTPRHVRR